MNVNKEWVSIRAKLKEIKEEYKESEDVNLSNFSVVCDLMILCTYSPEELEPLYHTINKHIDDLLGGAN